MTMTAPLPVGRYDGGALRFDHLELWVGNAKQAAEYYITALGFRPLAYAGPETGLADRASYVVAQGDIRLVLTSALRPGGAINDHVARHGDGVRSVAFSTPDATATFRHLVAHGAKPVFSPAITEEAGARAVQAAVATYGDTIHTLIERSGASAIWLPGFIAWDSPAHAGTPVGLCAIDHCVGNVGWGEMETWCRFYAGAFDFQELISFDDRDISTEYTALRSKVMRNATGTVKLPINEPANTSSPTAAPACSTLRSPPMTSSPPCARCRLTASSCSPRPHRTTTISPRASARSLKTSRRCAS
jgi:4-hydroxyphenylpyruvate dioxygenase